MSISLRPPDSDSDDDYDGFYFGDSEPRPKQQYKHEQSIEDKLEIAITDGNLSELESLLKEHNWDIDKPLREEHTLLQLAVSCIQFEIAQYLVETCKADVDFWCKEDPPLLLACQATKYSEALLKIVQLLVENGAKISVTDMYNVNSLMFAAALGHVDIVRYLVQQGINIEQCNYSGNTALYHAIENNQAKVVEVLLELGAQADIVNRKGYSPVQVAQFYGFNDLLEILPKPILSNVPVEYLSYNTLRDYIPQLFLRTECPQYFQEVVAILQDGRLPGYIPYFARGKISLRSFLSLDDQDLIDLGFYLPVQRMIIKRLILRYFLVHWSQEYKDNNKETQPKKEEANTFYNILMMTASHLRQLIILKSTIRYLKQNLENDLFGELPKKQLEDFQKQLLQYKRVINDVQETAIYLAGFSPRKNPLHIDYQEYVCEIQQKQITRRRRIKHTVLFVGITVIIYLRLRKFWC